MIFNGYPVLYLEFDPDINFSGYVPKNSFTRNYLRSKLNQYGYLSKADWHNVAKQAYLVSLVNDSVVFSTNMPDLTMDQCKLIKSQIASSNT